MDTGNGERLVLANCFDSSVRMRRAKDFEMQQGIDFEVGGVTGAASGDRFCQRITQINSRAVTRPVVPRAGDTQNGFLNGMITGATA
jgi:hypothetical protein